MKRHLAVPFFLITLLVMYFPIKIYTGLDNKQIQAILVFIALFFMLAFEYRHRTVLSLASLAVIWYLGILSSEDMVHYLDFDVLGLLFGMMVIVESLREAGFLSIISRVLISLRMKRFYQLIVVLSLLTFFLSALLDNATLILIIVPIVMEICETLRLNPIPALITLAVSSNIGGLATPVGDPPNIMISSHLGTHFSQFVRNALPPALLNYLISLGVIAIMFREHLGMRIESAAPVDAGPIVKNRRLLLAGIPTLITVILLFFLEDLTGIRPSSAALYGAVFLLMVGGDSMAVILREVNWDLLIFLGSILVFSGALERVGVLHILTQTIFSFTHDNESLLITLITWISSLASAFVDNIPYTAVMIPALDELVGLTGSEILWWVLVISIGLGGIATPIASVPSLVAYSVLRERYGFRFSEFMRIGFIILAVLASFTNIYYVLLSLVS